MELSSPDPTQSPVSTSCGAVVHGEGGDPKNASLPPQSEREGQTAPALSVIQAQREAQESDPAWLREQLAKARAERDEAIAARTRAVEAFVDCEPAVTLLVQRDDARELAAFKSEQVERLQEERDQLRARVAELEAHLPRMDGPSRVEYLERRVAELEETEAFLDGQMQELDGLRAKLAEQEWLPIETAPRDGTWILTWNLLLERPITVRGYGISLGNDTHWMPLPPGPAYDVSEARQTCAEEGCAAPSEKMRAIVERELRAFAEASLEEDELYTCPSCDEVDSLMFDKDLPGFWRCICGAPEDESGYRPAGEVERG